MDKEPESYENRPLYDRLNRKRFQAGLVLTFENAVESFWRPALWAAFFSGLWFLQIPSVIGKSGSMASLILFAAGLLWFLWRDSRMFRCPSREDIDRRLEDYSKLPHRPLTAIHDRLANPQEGDLSKTLWSRSKSRALVTIGKLKTPLPRPVLAARDPVALRALVALIVIVGFIVAGPAWKERLQLGLNPLHGNFDKKPDKSITIRITPPEYTAQPEIILQGGGRHKEVLNIPESSVIKIHVSKGPGTPSLVINKQKKILTRVDNSNWSIESSVTPGEKIEVWQFGLRRALIPYRYIRDAPPEITLIEEPQTKEKGQMQVALKVKDDYSVDNLFMRLRLDSAAEDPPLGTPFEEKRAVASPPGTTLELEPIYDLAWHPWAGLPVTIDISAADHKGQITSLPPLHVTLPERTFQHPVARKLISLRKRLIKAPEATAKNAAHELFEILREPQNYGSHPVIFLSLRSMEARLIYDPTLKNIRGIISQLWDTALQLEEGNLALAYRDLKDAQRNLEDTLNRPDATPEEIRQSLDEFREAMANYLQEMMNEMQKQAAASEMNSIPLEAFSGIINPDDLQDFMDELAAQSMAGNREAAREMLSKMQQMMDSLNPSTGQMEMPKDMKFMIEAISTLQILIKKQEELLEKTRDQAKKSPPDSSGGGQEQQSLRHDLGELMRDADEALGQIPDSLGKAELAMRESEKHLGENNPDMSASHQKQALRYLKESMDQMSDQLVQQLKQMMAMSMGGSRKFDPMGRPIKDGNGPSWLPSSQVKIPDESERKRIREILDTIRRRSGELNRPDYELEYYRRLMQQF